MFEKLDFFLSDSEEPFLLLAKALLVCECSEIVQHLRQTKVLERKCWLHFRMFFIESHDGLENQCDWLNQASHNTFQQPCQSTLNKHSRCSLLCKKGIMSANFQNIAA